MWPWPTSLGRGVIKRLEIRMLLLIQIRRRSDARFLCESSDVVRHTSKIRRISSSIVSPRITSIRALACQCRRKQLVMRRPLQMLLLLLVVLLLLETARCKWWKIDNNNYEGDWPVRQSTLPRRYCCRPIGLYHIAAAAQRFLDWRTACDPPGKTTVALSNANMDDSAYTRAMKHGCFLR